MTLTLDPDDIEGGDSGGGKPLPILVADEKKDEKKKLPIMLIAIAGIVLLLLAGGISYFIATNLAPSKESAAKAKPEEPGILFKVGDPKEGVIVNIANRYVKTSIVLELRPVKTKAKAEESKGGLSLEEVKISDAVIRVLRAQKPDDFEASKQEALKEKIKSEVNSALGEDRVMHVYITSIVLQ